MTLSERGRGLLSGTTPEYLLTHFQRIADRWHPTDNPDGYLGLCVAENAIVWDLIGPRVNRSRRVPASAFAYDSMLGSERFRGALGQFLGDRLARRPIDSQHVSALAGAGTVLESLFYAIADPGDAVLVPTPSYAGFWHDLETRNRLNIVTVDGRSEAGFEVGPAELEAALAECEGPVRALLLTNPDNPRGTVLPRAKVDAILDWAEGRQLHVVVDEVYAFSVFGSEFRSVLARPKLGPRLHAVWAFSKDFAASGLRCGILVSENEELRQALDSIAYWGCVSGDTQRLLTELLEDDEWLTRYLTEMPQRLRASYEATAEALNGAGIPFEAAAAGFFVLVDVRQYLAEPTFESEHALWRHFLDAGNVSLTPGQACRIAMPGFLRLCHAAAPAGGTQEAVRRIAALLP